MEELARRQGVWPTESVEAMARPELFDSDSRQVALNLQLSQTNERSAAVEVQPACVANDVRGVRLTA